MLNHPSYSFADIKKPYKHRCDWQHHYSTKWKQWEHTECTRMNKKHFRDISCFETLWEKEVWGLFCILIANAAHLGPDTLAKATSCSGTKISSGLQKTVSLFLNESWQTISTPNSHCSRYSAEWLQLFSCFSWKLAQRTNVTSCIIFILYSSVICFSQSACFHSSFLVFLFMYLPISVCLSCLPRVFLFSHSTWATPPQLLSSSINSQRWLSFCECLCLWETGSQRKMDRDNVCLYICCLFCLICFFSAFCVYFERRVGKKQEYRDVMCGAAQKAACGTKNVKLISLVHY